MIEYKKGEVQKGGAIPFGLLASIAAPVSDEVAKPILGKIFGRGRNQRKRLKKKMYKKKTR